MHRFFHPGNFEAEKIGLEIAVKNKDGCVEFEPAGSSSSAAGWAYGGWAKIVLAAGAVWYYRNELRIIGRGILAGANLAISRWEANKTEVAPANEHSPAPVASSRAPESSTPTADTKRKRRASTPSSHSGAFHEQWAELARVRGLHARAAEEEKVEKFDWKEDARRNVGAYERDG